MLAEFATQAQKIPLRKYPLISSKVTANWIASFVMLDYVG